MSVSFVLRLPLTCWGFKKLGFLAQMFKLVQMLNSSRMFKLARLPQFLKTLVSRSFFSFGCQIKNSKNENYRIIKEKTRS